MAEQEKAKPKYKYLRHCAHGDHPRGQCKEKSMYGTERGDGSVEFKKSSSTGRKAKP
jgi:hypothetical protein